MTHRILEYILRPLSDAGNNGVDIIYSDQVKHRCCTRVAGWTADHSESATIHAIYFNQCPLCECPADNLGDHPLSGFEYHKRDPIWYLKLWDVKDTTSFQTLGVKPIANILWTIPEVPWDIARADLLHTMFLGIIDHLMEWVQAFITEHNRLMVFEDIRRSILPYPQVFVPRKPYKHLSQVTEKKMRSILKIILAVFTATLRWKNDLPRPSVGQEVEFKKAITCV